MRAANGRLVGGTRLNGGIRHPDSLPAKRGRNQGLRYRFQLQMPPDLQGQTWIRVSKACASSGLPCRRASLVRAAPCGFAARICACATRLLRTIPAILDAAILGWAFGSTLACAPSLPRSTCTSSGPGANVAGGPIGFGESSALGKSRPRNSPGRYSSATDRPAPCHEHHADDGETNLFQDHDGLLKYAKSAQQSLI